ncbi:MAG TPA: SMR family transporter [Methylomirabilota bacterium]|jgi:drug/metabolite transporter (DMT)-like permease|nr:SMR family transporter [Methylomirabilota bacterium]
MTAAALVLVVAAAFLHAGWNALAKRSRDPVAFLWLASAVAAPALSPWGVRELALAGLPWRAVPFVIGTIVLHVLYFYSLGRAYGTGAYSLVYPIARGLGVALVPILAWLLLDERLSRLGVAGIALVITGVLVLHRVGRPPAPLPGGALASASFWATLTGLTIASYSVLDKVGVSRLHPVPYVMLMEAGCVAVFAPFMVRRLPVARAEWAANRWTIAATGLMSAGGYTLVLFAFQLSKAGYVVASRELSIVLSALIGSLLLREGRLTPRLAAATIVLAGVACVALAR